MYVKSNEVVQDTIFSRLKTLSFPPRSRESFRPVLISYIVYIYNTEHKREFSRDINQSYFLHTTTTPSYTTTSDNQLHITTHTKNVSEGK